MSFLPYVENQYMIFISFLLANYNKINNKGGFIQTEYDMCSVTNNKSNLLHKINCYEKYCFLTCSK